MAKVIGVKFRNSGKIYFFDTAGIDIQKDDHVIVETGLGIDYGFVVSGVREIDESKLFQPLKPIMRKANERDEEQVKENERKSKEAFNVCLEKVRAHGLDMKLTEVEYAFDNSKILFYFTSDGYVDFRELVKDLAGTFRTRIELRQIGVRDEARAIGGLGACGRPMCCAAYLPDFVPVSIKMAKEQNLPLNPTKISGVCGRLMCCLKYEEETYEELNKTMPDVGDFVEGSDGLQGDVFSTNVLRQTVKVLVENGDEKEMHDYSAEEITILRKRKGKKTPASKEEAIDEKQLEALEDKPAKEEKRGNKDNKQNREDKRNREDNQNREDRKPREDNRNREENQKQDNRNRDNQNSDNRNREDKAQERPVKEEANRNNNVSAETDNNQENGGRNRDRHGRHGKHDRRGNRDNRDNRENRENRENHSGFENRGDRQPQNNFENREAGANNQGNRENDGNGENRKNNNFRHKKNRRFHDKNKGAGNGNTGNAPEN